MILVIALVVCFVMVSKLKSDVSRLKNAMHNQYQQFMNQVESIYDNVDTMLKEEASLLSSVSAEYGEMNLEDHTIRERILMIRLMEKLENIQHTPKHWESRPPVQ